MKTPLKIALIVLVLVVIAGVAFWAKSLIPIPGAAARAQAAAGPPPVPVSVAPVLEEKVTEWDEFSGRIQAIDRVEVRPQVSGILEKVHFEDGQIVKKGDALFTIDPRPYQADLAHAQAMLASAQARSSYALSTSNRNTKLIQSHAIAQNDVDQSTSGLLDAQAAVKAAEAAVMTAQLNLNYCSIVAPVDGRVSRAEITVGNLVNSGTNAPVLTTVVSVNPVYVEFDMDEQTFLSYAANGATGNSGLEHMPVAMGLANEEGYPHTGHLHSLDNQLDTTSGTIRVRAIFDNPTGELTPGLYAKIRTGGSAAKSAVLVDDRAIGTDQDKKFVMVVDADNRANYRAVTLGPVVNGLRVIRSGLQKDEHIVVNGLQRVRPNSLVSPTVVGMDRAQDPASGVSVSSK